VEWKDPYRMRQDLIQHQQSKPLVAASHYLNSAPLIWSFLHGPRQQEIELIDAVPSRCGQLLALGEVDAALVPVIEFQRIPDLTVVPDVCVGSREKVLSVVLASKKEDLRDVQTVALDESSRTSAALVKIIFREFLDAEPRWTPSQPDLQQMLAKNDAALIIGDPGMTFERQGLFVFDMASLWREYTGLGFVFAMWMMGENSVERCRRIDFRTVGEEGLACAEEIAAVYEKQLGLSFTELLDYLRVNITYRMDAEMRSGLELYYKLAAKHGLIEKVKQLEFR
jgi:chorismate dehydratase